MKISIIIPVFNKSKTIERTIKSILSQSLKDIQVVLVDDKSQDSSVSVIEQLQELDSRILLVKLSENSGPMFARMEGCIYAAGDYIIFCDADDMLPEKSLENMYSKIVSENADVVFANMNYVKQTGTIIEKKASLPYGYDTPDIYRAMLTWKAPHSLCAKIYKRDLFVDHKYTIIKNQNNGEDGWMLYQVLEHAKKVSLLDKSVYNYFEDENSTTHQKYSDNTLSQMVLSNIEIISIALKYDDLEPYAYRHILRNYTSWCASGFGWHKVDRIIKSYGHVELTKVGSLYKYYSAKKATQLLLEKYVKGLINYIKY